MTPEPTLDARTERAIYVAVLEALAEREASSGGRAGLVVNPHPLLAWLDESTGEILIDGIHEFPSPSLTALLESRDRWTACAMERLSCNRETHPRFVTLSDVILVSHRDGGVVAELVDASGERLLTERLHLSVRAFRGEWNVVGG